MAEKTAGAASTQAAQGAPEGTIDETGSAETVVVMPVTREKTNFDQKNEELFTKRLELVATIEELEAKPRLGSTQKVKLRMSRRDLERVNEQIVELNKGLVLSYTRLFTSNSSREDTEDFEAAGMEGLMKAISSFDPSRGRFGQWAYKPIQRKVLRAVRDADFRTMTPGDFERRPDIKRAFEALQGDDDSYHPAHAEVAAHAGVTEDQVRRVLDAPRLDSIHQIVGEDGDTELGELIEGDTVGVEDLVVSHMTLSSLEEFGLQALDVRELMVIVRRFGLDGEPPQKLAAIGDMLGLSREAVRQVESKALSKIQHPVILRKIYRQGR